MSVNRVASLRESGWAPSSGMLALRRLAADEFGISESALIAPDVRRDAQARQACALVLRRCWPRLSAAQIALLLNRKDHSTICHAFRVAQRRAARDPDYAARIARLEARGRELAARRARPAVPMHFIIERPGRSEPACAQLLTDIALAVAAPLRRHQMFTGQERGPRLTREEVAERADQVARERAERQAALLAAERAKYGVTRQTMVRPLSEQVA